MYLWHSRERAYMIRFWLNSFLAMLMLALKENFRNPAVLFWGYGFPVLMAIGLGVAFSQQNKMVYPIGIMVKPNSANWQVLETKLGKATCKNNPSSSLNSSPEELKKIQELGFDFICMDSLSLNRLMVQGKVRVILGQHPNRKPNISRDSLPTWKFYFDPSNSEATMAYYKLNLFLAGKNTQISNNPNVEIIKTQGQRYIDFLVPGLVAMGVMFSCLWGSSYVLIERRSKRILRRMRATPMIPTAFFSAQIGSRFFFTYTESLVLILFSWWLFDVKVTGSWWALHLILFSGSVCFVGLGVLLSSRGTSTEVGNGLINLVSMPMMVVSGVFYSYQYFPEVLKSVIRWLPLTQMADSLRSIFNEGSNFTDFTFTYLLLTSFGVVCLSIGIKIFKWN